jgi:NADPH:quinone reductase-like Zn-dependent oxidoreductase
VYDTKPEPFALDLGATLESGECAVAWCDVNDSAKVGSISHDAIAVFDLERPFFEDISAKSFQNFMEWVSNLKSSGVLWLTRAAQIRSTNPAYAQIIGLARTVRVEASVDIWTVELQSIDADQVAPVVAVAKRFLERRPDAGRSVDCEFAIHEGTVMVGRYDWSPKDQVTRQISSEEEVRKSMRIGQRGLLNTIHWVKDTAPSPGDDEVQLNVQYSGLNFKDVMISMGLIPGDHGLCGCEAAGVVISVGSNVHHIKPGDRVFTLGRGLLSTRLNIPAATVFPLPADLSFEAAATLPAVYCTAIYAIFDKARLEKGQSILIHAASGGVGQAALQLCRMLGVDIYATVGSEEKVQHLVEEYGLDGEHIFNSRDDSFYEDVMRVTKGRGVDMVLNSLSGELLHASWRCVARFGIMVEIGKRDMLEHGRLPMDMFSGNRTFCGIDLDSMQDRPQLSER